MKVDPVFDMSSSSNTALIIWIPFSSADTADLDNLVQYAKYVSSVDVGQ